MMAANKVIIQEPWDESRTITVVRVRDGRALAPTFVGTKSFLDVVDYYESHGFEITESWQVRTVPCTTFHRMTK